MRVLTIGTLSIGIGTLFGIVGYTLVEHGESVVDVVRFLTSIGALMAASAALVLTVISRE